MTIKTSLLVAILATAVVGSTPTASAIGPLDFLGLDEECTNYGVMAVIGSFECGDCTNHGVVAWYGNTCWGDGNAGACVDSTCVDSSKAGTVTTHAHPASCCPVPPGIVSGTPGEACGVVDDPACWSLRFACYYGEAPVQRVLPLFHCTKQPDAGDGDLKEDVVDPLNPL